MRSRRRQPHGRQHRVHRKGPDTSSRIEQMEATPTFKDKFIAFVDILGWKKMVEAAEADTGKALPELLHLLTKLGSTSDPQHKFGPTICPQSLLRLPDLDFQVTQISDSVVLSAEVSPVGVINLVSQTWL